MNEILGQRLNSRKWFQNSQKIVRDLIEKEIDDSIVKYLSEIQDESEFGDILNLHKIWKEESVFGTVFQIRSKENNQIKEVKSINWIESNNPLARGLILAKTSGGELYLLAEKKFNLITFKNEIRSFGIAYPDFSEGKLIKLPQKISKALAGQNINKFWDLGYVYADSNLIAGKSNLFAVSVDIGEIESVDKDKIEVVEINKVDELIEFSHDNYLIAIVSKLRSKKII